MTDQDRAPNYVEAGLPQKPVNLDAKLPIQMGRSKSSSKLEENSGPYYLNVAQKGKLILPTALWIMLIIAGICFLTLLASLNKSINALDTLVELEQEKEARAMVNEHLHHRRLSKELKMADEREEQKQQQQQKSNKPKKSRKKTPTKVADSGDDEIKVNGMTFKKLNDDSIQDLVGQPAGEADGWFVPLDPSWFSLPSWTSLEPMRREPSAPMHPDHHESHSRNPLPPPPPPMGMLEDLFKAPIQGAAVVIGEEPNNQPPSWLRNSLGPMMDLLNGGGRGDEPFSQPLDDVEPLDVPAMISAKIDNLNININPAPAASEPAAKKQSPSREDEINSLERSIDDLVGKLIDQKASRKDNKHQHHQQLEGIEEIRPIVSANEIHHRRPGAPPMPLLLDSLMDSLIPERRLAPMMGHTFNLDEPMRAGPKRPSNGMNAGDLGDAQLIISISDETPPHFKPSRETNRHQVSNTRRPAASHEPYEFPSGIFEEIFPPPSGPLVKQPTNKHDHHVTKAGGNRHEPSPLDLIQSVFDETARLGPAANKQADMAPQFFVIDDTMPLGPGEQPHDLPTVLSPDNMMFVDLGKPADMGRGKNGVQNEPMELFDLLMGAKPTSVEPKQKAKNPTKAGNGNKSTPTTLATTKKQTTQQTAISPIEFSVSTKQEPKMTPQAKAKVDTIVSELPTMTSQAMREEEASTNHKDAHDMLSDFVSTMFALPQMSGNGQAQQVGPAGGAQVKPSSGGAPAGNSTKESMVCECHKLPSNSTTAGRPASGSSSDGPGGANVGRGTGAGPSSSSGGSSGGNSSSGGNPPSASSGGSSSSGSGSSSGSRPGGISSDSSRDVDGSGGSRGSRGPDRSGSGSSSSSGDRMSAAQSGSSSVAQPIGYVPVIARRPNETPRAFAAAPLMSPVNPFVAEPPAPLILAAQSSSNSSAPAKVPPPSSTGPKIIGATSSVASSPVANARPGSVLSALNNNTNHLLPRLINRLNNTDMPKFRSNSTPPIVTALLEIPLLKASPPLSSSTPTTSTTKKPQ